MTSTKTSRDLREQTKSPPRQGVAARLDSVKGLDPSERLADPRVVGSVRDAITTLGHRKRQLEIHRAMKKSFLLTLRARLKDKTSVSVMVDENSRCQTCHKSLNISTACVMIDRQLYCQPCTTQKSQQ